LSNRIKDSVSLKVSDIHVNLIDGVVIEEITVAFHICSFSQESLELTLVTLYFKRNRNILKSLQKLSKQASCGNDSKLFKNKTGTSEQCRQAGIPNSDHCYVQQFLVCNLHGMIC
jgi:hypothetical protein